MQMSISLGGRRVVGRERIAVHSRSIQVEVFFHFHHGYKTQMTLNLLSACGSIPKLIVCILFGQKYDGR